MTQNLLYLQAVQTLEAELAVVDNSIVPMAAIKDYLLTAMKDNSYLQEMILTSNRTLAACATYVEGQVREALSNKSGYLPDAEVYGMAEDFYYLSDEDIQALLTSVPKVTSAQSKHVRKKEQTAMKEKTVDDQQMSLFETPDEQKIESKDSEAAVDTETEGL